MIGHGGGGGDDAKMLKNNIFYKTYLKLILYKPVGKYQFTMACIQGFSYDFVPSN